MADRLDELGSPVSARTNYKISLAVESVHDASAVIEALRADPGDGAPKSLAEDALDRLKFSECVPKNRALEMLRHRLEDSESVTRTLGDTVVTS